jgi:hypothetical protein
MNPVFNKYMPYEFPVLLLLEPQLSTAEYVLRSSINKVPYPVVTTFLVKKGATCHLFAYLPNLVAPMVSYPAA